MDIRVVFMGTPSFAVPILEGLISKYNVVMVVCQPDRKKDRKGNIEYPEVKKIALEHNIDVFQPEHIKKDYQKILDTKPDIIITCAYGQIIPDSILNYPKYGCINVHGSLLPDLRGGAPIHWALIRGYKETGITIMYMASKMDAGDIISQASIPIDDDIVLGELYEKLSYLGKDLLLKTLPDIINNNVTRKKQDSSKVTYGYNISRDDAHIDFSKTKTSVRNLIRGLNPYPAAYCFLEGKRIKIYAVDILDEKLKSDYKCGQIVRVDKDGIICATLDGFIKIKELAVEGKKRCLAKDYLNGVNKIELIGKVLS